MNAAVVCAAQPDNASEVRRLAEELEQFDFIPDIHTAEKYGRYMMDDYALGDRYTAVATYSGTATSSYVTGYTVTAKYEGTVSKIALDRVRYVAVFEGTEIKPVITIPEIPEIDDPMTSAPDKTAPDGGFSFNWAYIFIPLGVVVLIGGGVAVALFLKRRSEMDSAEGGQ